MCGIREWGAATLTMGVVAQAFGLALETTDIVAGTYLYQLPRATTLGFVKKSQDAYRDGAARQRATITAPSAAYHLIQGYLSLCLPPTIESMLLEHISGARAAPDTSGANVSVVFGSSNSVAELKVLEGSSTRLPPLPPINHNQGLTGSFITLVEDRLCVPRDGQLGGATLQAIIAFSRAYAKAGGVTSATTEVLTGADKGLLKQLVDEEAPCPHGEIKTPQAVGTELFALLN